MLLKFKGKVMLGCFRFFFFKVSFKEKQKVSTHLKVLLQKFKRLEEVRKEGEGTRRKIKW